MPVTYRSDPEHRRIVTRCEGETTLAEVLAHFDELEADPDYRPGSDVLLDLTDIISLPNVGQIRVAATRAGDAARRVQFGACAIVVSSEAMFGMARIFDAFTERFFARTGVFRDRETAERWLDSPGPN